MRISVLSSGSKANCTLVEIGSTRILIDCGLSARATCERLTERGIAPETLHAILVTHEHSDHIRGVRVMSARFGIPVYANRGTARCIDGCDRLELFNTGEEFSVGELTVSPFSIVHDAADPVGFVVQGQGLRFAQATDLGRVTPLVRHALTGCNVLVLESNHDPDLLQQCGYPWQLKQRISSTHGHLSNGSAAALLQEVAHSDLVHVVLAHLSEHSNTPDHARRAASESFPEGVSFSLACAGPAAATPMLTL